MSFLKNLKIVAAPSKQLVSPEQRRRNKCVVKLAEQIEMAEAELAGKTFERMKSPLVPSQTTQLGDKAIRLQRQPALPFAVIQIFPGNGYQVRQFAIESQAHAPPRCCRLCIGTQEVTAQELVKKRTAGAFQDFQGWLHLVERRVQLSNMIRHRGQAKDAGLGRVAITYGDIIARRRFSQGDGKFEIIKHRGRVSVDWDSVGRAYWVSQQCTMVIYKS